MVVVAVVVSESVLAGVRDNQDLSFGIPEGNRSNNSPQQRRNLILQSLLNAGISVDAAPPSLLSLATCAHDKGLIEFFENAYRNWKEQGFNQKFADPLVPGGFVPHFFLRGDAPPHPSVYSKVSFYANDNFTPILPNTAAELSSDMGVVQHAVHLIVSHHSPFVYGLVTHPGHHAAPMHFGGYCFVNNAVVASRLLIAQGRTPAIVDVDYHAGDGTYQFLKAGKIEHFVSLQAGDEYPHVDLGSNGFDLAPGTDWTAYSETLATALNTLSPSVDCFVVSLGLDTLATDTETYDGFGFKLTPEDLGKMSTQILEFAQGRPVLVLQEGGYDLQGSAQAATEFLQAGQKILNS
eukprot:c17559_g1_i1.p1 GENE.c17559_g1_i1~~c17559_g1_i1.p1  ORF type:complete len:369 (+),score=76.49 c17559_g1_i1:58-1107(+)